MSTNPEYLKPNLPSYSLGWKCEYQDSYPVHKDKDMDIKIENSGNTGMDIQFMILY